MLRAYLDEVREGKRSSIISTQTIESLSADDKEAWRHLRKELEGVGITPELYKQHREVIVTTLEKAFIEEGLVGDIAFMFCDSSGPDHESSEPSSPSFVISSAEPDAKYTDEPLQQPTRDWMTSNETSNTNRSRHNRDVGQTGSLSSEIIDSKTSLVEAVKRREAILTKRLLDKGAAVDSVDEYGRTPLFWAAVNGDRVLIELLLDNGAATYVKDMHGRTPLFWAAHNGDVAVVRLLLDKGAAPELKYRIGLTPLLRAAYYGHEGVIKLLLKRGAAVDSKDVWGRTPLFWAAYNGNEAVVKLLLKNGAAVDSKDYSGQTALDWAVERRRKAVVKLLESQAPARSNRRLLRSEVSF